MTALRRLACPTCGALFERDATHGAARCEYCGRRAALAEQELLAPRQAIQPGVERSQALLALRRALLAENVLPRSLRGAIEPVDARLIFVPFFVARGLRAGVVERPVIARTSYETVTLPDGTPQTRAVRKEPPPTDDRARVVLTDVERSGPAVRRPDWGLEALGVGALLAGGAVLEPFDPDRVRRHGGVLAPDLEPAEIVERLRADSGHGETRLHLPSVRTVLVPVWRIRFRVRGGLYDATVDGVAGRLLAARAPENDRHRVPMAMLGLGLACLCVGWVLRFFVVWPATHRALPMSGPLDAVLYVAVALLVVLGVFATYAWNVVRYDADRMYDNGRLWAEYLNKPPSTALDRFWERLFEGLGRGLESSRRRRDDV